METRAAPRLLRWPAAAPGVLEVAKALGRRRLLKPGDVLQASGGPARAFAVASGLLRAVISSVTGREATVVYASPGAFVGEGIFYETAKGTLVAMLPTVVYEIPPEHLEALRERHPDLKLLLLDDLESVIDLLLAAVAEQAFGDLRIRLARHLLALAQVNPATRRAEVPLTRDELASEVASTADVVSRALRAMAREGLVALRPQRIELLDVHRLLNIATTL